MNTTATGASFALDRYQQEMGLLDAYESATLQTPSLLNSTKKQKQEIAVLLRQLEVLLPMGEARLRFSHLKVIETSEAESSGVLDGGVHVVTYLYKGQAKYRLYTPGEQLDPAKRESVKFLPYYTGETGQRQDGSEYRKRDRDAVWLGIELPLLQAVNQAIEAETQERMKVLYQKMQPNTQTQRTQEECFLIEAYYSYCDRRSCSESVEDNKRLMYEFFGHVEELRKGRASHPSRLTQLELIRLIKREMYNQCGRLAKYYSSKDPVWVSVGGKTRIVFQTRRKDPQTNRWLDRSPQELVAEMHRCLLELAYDKIGKDRVRLDEAASFYAPVTFAENEAGRGAGNGGFEEEVEGGEGGWLGDWQRSAIAQEPEEDQKAGYGVEIVDVVKALPWAVLVLNTAEQTSKWETHLRFEQAAEAIQTLESTLSTAKKRLTADAFGAVQARFAIVQDPTGQVGAVGSQGLLRTLPGNLKQQIRDRRFEVEGDRVIVHIPGVSRESLKMKPLQPAKADNSVEPKVGASLSTVGF